METISSESKKSYIAFFDLDRTLIAANSGRALVNLARKKGMMPCTGLIRAIYLSLLYKLDLKDTVKILGDMAAWVKGLPEKSIIDLSCEVSASVLIPSIYREALAEINNHRGENAALVMLSSAIRPVCREVAGYLYMDDVLCSDLEVNDGYCTGGIAGNFCFGEEKAIRLIKYCESNNISPDKTWYYGDSISDLPALSIAGFPVCVNPDKKLLKIARAKGWRIFRWE